MVRVAYFVVVVVVVVAREYVCTVSKRVLCILPSMLSTVPVRIVHTGFELLYAYRNLSNNHGKPEILLMHTQRNTTQRNTYQDATSTSQLRDKSRKGCKVDNAKSMAVVDVLS